MCGTGRLTLCAFPLQTAEGSLLIPFVKIAGGTDSATPITSATPEIARRSR